MKEPLLKIDQTDANKQRLVYFSHHFLIQMRDLVRETLLVDRPDLLEQHDRIALHSVLLRLDLHMRRKLRLLNLRRNRRYDNRRTEPVADIVLNDEHRAHAALLGPDDRRQVRVEHIPAFDDQSLHPAHEPSERALCVFLGMERFGCHVQVNLGHLQVSPLHRVADQSFLSVDQILLHRLTDDFAAIGILVRRDIVHLAQQMIGQTDHNPLRIVQIGHRTRTPKKYPSCNNSQYLVT